MLLERSSTSKLGARYICSKTRIFISCLFSYKLGEKAEAFYTGGVVQFTNNGRHILTTCGSAVKVLSVDTGLVAKSIEEVRKEGGGGVGQIT